MSDNQVQNSANKTLSQPQVTNTPPPSSMPGANAGGPYVSSDYQVKRQDWGSVGGTTGTIPPYSTSHPATLGETIAFVLVVTIVVGLSVFFGSDAPKKSPRENQQ